MLERGLSFDMILLDITSGDTGVFGFIRKVKGYFASIPLLVLTDSSIAQEVAVLELGVADIQSVPVNASLLRHRMINLLTRQEMMKAIQSGTVQHDEISGFMLRPAFLSVANELIRTSPSGAYMMVCFDVADFKLINTRLGQEHGDRLLRQLSDALRHVTDNLRTAQTRAKADRFYALLPNDEALIYAFRKGYEEAIEHNLSVRFGLYLVTDREESVGDMMNKALLAMESLKGTVNRSVAWYQEEMMQFFLLKRQIIEDLPAALEAGQVTPWFQPKYNYAAKQWCGAEALARWVHPQYHLISPDVFIPVLEKAELFTRLDLFILEQVCAHQRRWKNMGLMTLRVSVNLSQMDFLHNDITDRILNVVDRYGMTGADIRFEITETAYIQNADILKNFIRRVHHRGFLLDMDDFGSGYSSLNMLDELEVDAVKLDAKMTHGSGEGKRSNHVLGAIVRLSGWLKMDILAEGVESKEQAEYLCGLGCVYMQGYYFSKPLPALDYEKLLGQQNLEQGNPLPLERIEHGLTLNNDTSIDIHDISTFLQVIGTIYPLIISQNYSKNKYYIMEYDHFSTTSCSSSGHYDDLIAQGTSSFHPDDRDSFSATFHMETVLDAFERGLSQLTHEGRQLGDDGIYRWIRTRVYLYRDQDGDLKGYTLSRNMEELTHREPADGLYKGKAHS